MADKNFIFLGGSVLTNYGLITTIDTNNKAVVAAAVAASGVLRGTTDSTNSTSSESVGAVFAEFERYLKSLEFDYEVTVSGRRLEW
ncbi:hypothetical protein [Paenibacillus sp. RC67]|uniref:hypothetical protein n=1 Tax=Paenibacillus sp. RC67 TaxID=3039392 RepID=UPI0024AD2790|nr:hypothetical protein [Paenibacillus sp. RC67]